MVSEPSFGDLTMKYYHRENAHYYWPNYYQNECCWNCCNLPLDCEPCLSPERPIKISYYDFLSRLHLVISSFKAQDVSIDIQYCRLMFARRSLLFFLWNGE